MISATIWNILTKYLLFHCDPEKVHNLALSIAQRHSFNNFYTSKRKKSNRIFLENEQGLSLKTHLGGISWQNPIGLAAGLDKNGQAPFFWSSLGFGAVEIGTVTVKPQDGNPRPRIFRLKSANALINRMGFNNGGMDYLAEHLEKLFVHYAFDVLSEKFFSLGINLGKNKDVPLDQAPDDYLRLSERFIHFADYFTINISSPNTPGLRDLQDEKPLRSLLGQLNYHGFTDKRAYFLKLAPDLELSALKQAVQIAIENKFSGVIIANTTIRRDFKGIALLASGKEQGGLSGAPLMKVTPDLIAGIHEEFPDFPIIGVGGIMSFADMRLYLQAGAKAVQIYTGLIYKGPNLVRKLLQDLYQDMHSLQVTTYDQYLKKLR